MRSPVSQWLVTMPTALAATAFIVAGGARMASQGSAQSYTVYTAEGRRSLPFRTSGATDVVALEQLAAMFNLTVAEDPVVGGLTVRGAGQAILLIPNQSFASVGPGRVVSLPIPVQRDRGAWQVPVEFIRQALGPALNQRVEIRRPTHVILMGDVRLPQISGHLERPGPGARVVLDIEPAAPFRASREGNRLTLQFDAVAIDFTPISGLVPEFVPSIRAEGVSLVLTLGPSAAGFRIDDADKSHVQIDIAAAGAPPPAPNRPDVPAPPAVDLTPSSGLRTIVIDPGHGGDDEGVKTGSGGKEKDYALQLARGLKAAIESRLGLRVLLTRDTDENVALDRRAALANNNKADLFISLHANASVRPAAAGVQVLTLRREDYPEAARATETGQIPVAVLGGGTRQVDLIPWEAAQVAHTAQSAAVADLLLQHLTSQGVPVFKSTVDQLPLRSLAGINMPALLVEAGFLSNPAEEAALLSGDRGQNVIDGLVATIADVRRGIPTPQPGGAGQ